ncbi:neuramidase [Tritrichomonas foetus]|uniref:Neuramidase n=1 Tax=Tritrichomonas foetus TaxID=1144522 RepID=A0A1J4JL65_9EUKA|nr:neuramidase [Tritrichomonas foetus]|eukprot:OHS99826.1 neuramidase [Tritrichomonas foetus]
MNMFLFLFALCLSEEPFKTVLFVPGDEGSKQYRIPSVTTCLDGTLIAVTDKRWNHGGDLPAKIDVVAKRSTDNGKTWGETITIASGNPNGYGDAALVVDRETGTVLCIFNGDNGFWQSTPTNPIRNYVSKSFDNGKTWTKPVDITPMLYGAECPHPERSKWLGMFVTSGAAIQLRSGRIMLVGVTRVPTASGIHDYVVYSDDCGDTWDIGLTAGCDRGDESKVIELNNGDVLMSIRHAPYRYQAISHDKGLTFDDYTERKDIPDPACNGEILRYTSTKDGYDKDRILFVNDYSTAGRKNLTMKLSYDEGKTWAVEKNLHPAGSAYSAITICNDGTIVVYFEDEQYGDGEHMTIMTFSLEWLTDGKDKWTPSNPAKVKKGKK